MDVNLIRGMYGLPQAGSLVCDLLKHRLNKEQYFQSQTMPGFWKHKTKSIQFVLVVDNFGIKYLWREDLDHLICSLKNIMMLLSISMEKSSSKWIRLGLQE